MLLQTIKISLFKSRYDMTFDAFERIIQASDLKQKIMRILLMCTI